MPDGADVRYRGTLFQRMVDDCGGVCNHGLKGKPLALQVLNDWNKQADEVVQTKPMGEFDRRLDSARKPAFWEDSL